MYTKALLAVTVSETSELLVESLLHLPRAGLKEVVLVHVVKLLESGTLSEQIRDQDKQFLESQKKILEQKGIKVKIKIPAGFVSSEVNRIAEEEKVSLIVIGSHDRKVLKDLILGSAGEQIVRDARRPVMIMKLAKAEGKERGIACKNLFHTILYPTDFSNNAEKVLPYLEKALDAGCEKVILLHVQEENRIMPHLEHRLEEFNQIDKNRLERVKKELIEAGAKEVKIVIKLGKTIPVILDTAEKENPCLIALGSRGRTLLDEIFIGGTANNIARYAKIPVLLVT